MTKTKLMGVICAGVPTSHRLPQIWGRDTRGLKSALVMVAIVGTYLIPRAQAQTFSEEFERLLAAEVDGGSILGCNQLVGNDRDPNSDQPVGLGPQLTEICKRTPTSPGVIGGTPSISSASAGGASTSESIAANVTRRKQFRGEEGKKGSGDGASGDAQFELGGGISLWLSGQYDRLDRDVTRFADGYESEKWSVTAGADIHLADQLIAGAAINHYRWDGNYESVGDFKTDSWGPILYASISPWDGFFADFSFLYATTSISDARGRAFQNTGDRSELYSGFVKGDPDAKDYEFSALFGYDHNIDRVSIGPRIGFRYLHSEIDAYTEKGSSGLELSYQEDDANSMQSIIGLQAKAAFSTDFAELVPDISVEWRHEFQNDQRRIYAQFAQDLRATPTTFSYQTDKPDRDFFNVGAGVVAVLPRGPELFARFDALVGHDFYDEYTVSIGLRLTL